MKNLIILLALIFTCVGLLHAHGGKKHKKDSVRQDSSIVKSDSVPHDHDHGGQDHHAEKPVKAELEDFPSLHPLIVHFAIVLILVAALLQLINAWFLKKEFSWIITGMIVIGFNAALLASTKFHPHTHDLSEHAKLVLAQHDLYAEWTLYLAGIACAFQILNLFAFRQKRWAAGIVSISMIAASYCIVHAGHYGAQLVHIEGVGPQGKFLETEHHH